MSEDQVDVAGQAPNTDELSKGKTCLCPGCEKPARWKGLCASDYGHAKKLIDANETTWEELAELGLAMTKQNNFRMEFLKRKAAQAGNSEESPATTHKESNGTING